jgi:hypothetical protein
METVTVGRTLVSAKIENVIDLHALSQGQICDDKVHRVEVSDALVDTGATLLGLPKPLIDQTLDFIVDRKRLQLIGNPAHGSEQMMDMF